MISDLNILRHSQSSLDNFPIAGQNLEDQVYDLRSLVAFQTRGVSRIVHELRSALVIANGYTKLLLEERAGSLNSAQREYLHAVAGSCGNIKQLLWTLSQIAEAEELRLDRVNIFSLLRETALSLFSEEIIHFTHEATLFVNGDRAKLHEAFRQIFTALLVIDSLEEVSIDAAEVDDKVTLSFSIRQSPADLELGSSLSISAFSVAHNILRFHGGSLTVRNSGARPEILIELPSSEHEKVKVTHI